MFDGTNFDTWVSAAQPGDRTTYFTGNLMAARWEPTGTAGKHKPRSVPAADAAWKAAEAGRVLLVQRRIGAFDPESGKNVFAYIAVKASTAYGSAW